MKPLQSPDSMIASTRMPVETNSTALRQGVQRVMFVNSSLKIGGAERVICHLATDLADRGLNVDVVCLQELGPLGLQLSRDVVPVHVLGSLRSYDIAAVWGLRALLRQRQPQVINVHDLPCLPYVMVANILSGNRPVVFTAHGLLYNDFSTPRWRYRFCGRRLAALTAVTVAAGQRHALYMGWNRRWDVLPNGVADVAPDPRQRSRLRRELHVEDCEFVFLAVGNVKSEKAYEDLLAAAAILPQSCDRPVTILVVGALGEDDCCASLLQYHKQLKLGRRVQFLGRRTDMAELYSAADGYILSSRSEGLPMALLEAMMAGLPVVATNVGGVGEIVSHERGLVVEPAQPKELASAMAKVANDPLLCRRLGQAARLHVQSDYGVKKMSEGYLSVFNRVVDRSS